MSRLSINIRKEKEKHQLSLNKQEFMVVLNKLL